MLWEDVLDTIYNGRLAQKGGAYLLTFLDPDPEFVNLLRGPGIHSQPGGPVWQPYLKYRPAGLHRLAESIPGLLKRLQIRAQIWEAKKPHKKLGNLMTDLDSK